MRGNLEHPNARRTSFCGNFSKAEVVQNKPRTSVRSETQGFFDFNDDRAQAVRGNGLIDLVREYVNVMVDKILQKEHGEKYNKAEVRGVGGRSITL